jgi:hypothetical protein
MFSLFTLWKTFIIFFATRWKQNQQDQMVLSSRWQKLSETKEGNVNPNMRAVRVAVGRCGCPTYGLGLP